MVELRPRRAKAEAPAEESPKKPRTPKAPASTKRKAAEDVSPAAIKKQKSAKKTPSKAKDIEEPEAVKEAVEPTPKAKKSKGKTPVKANDTGIPAVKEEQETPATKGKKKTPAKAEEPEVATPKTFTSKETDKVTSSKTKKEKTPAKAKTVTPSKAQKQAPMAKETPTEPEEIAKVVSEAVESTSASKTPRKSPKSGKKSAKKAVPVPEPEAVEQKDEIVQDTQESDVVPEEIGQTAFEEDDEHTKALVQTLDSSDEDDFDSGVVLFEEGQDVGKIPTVSKKEKKAAKKALAALKDKEDSGVIYVGRLPHGFYEHEMRSYFSQFGPIRNLRVSRSKKTGKAKHYAFVEFEEVSTAEIVAKTMDNYLLFGHILKCRVIPKAQVHADLFKGANKRFKAIPYNKKEANQLQRPQVEGAWERRIHKEQKRREQRARQLKAFGYEFKAPEVKAVGAAGTKAIAAPDAESSKANEAPPVAETATEASPAGEADKEQEATPQPAKRGRGRPAKTPQKASKAAETPRKTRRTKA